MQASGHLWEDSDCEEAAGRTPALPAKQLQMVGAVEGQALAFLEICRTTKILHFGSLYFELSRQAFCMG